MIAQLMYKGGSIKKSQIFEIDDIIHMYIVVDAVQNLYQATETR